MKDRFVSYSYDDMGNIISVSYDKLDNFIEQVLFNTLRYDKSSGRYYTFVGRLNDALLSDFEKAYTVNFLRNKGIDVRGRDFSFMGEYPNSKFKNINLLDNYDSDELMDKFILFKSGTLSEEEYEKLKEELIVTNMRLVDFVISKCKFIFFDIYDLRQFGYLGLINAVLKFDATKGFKFSTYAFHVIKTFIYKEISYEMIGTYNYGWIFSYIDYIEKCGDKINDNSDLLFAFFMEYGDKFDNCISKRLSIKGSSLENFVDTCYDDDFTDDVLDDIILSASLDVLDSEERELIEFRYGFIDGYKHSFKDCAEYYGGTYQRIFNINNQAIGKIRKRLKYGIN